ncbi:unnamed protein product, partial [Ixodes hexagonus]
LVGACAVRRYPCGPLVPLVAAPPRPPMLFPLMAAAAAQPRQVVYIFPPLELFDPASVRLVTDGGDASTAVACLLGFFRLVCEHGYRQLLEASERDGIWLVEVPVSPEYLRRKLRSLRPSGGEPDSRPTMDDFYLLLSVMLCNLPRVRGSNLSREWFQNRVNDLVQLFPEVSAPPRVPMYRADQADAIARFGEQWPHVRAALCRSLLNGRFDGPMEYVAVGWRFAGMKHVHLILEFLSGRNSWVLDVIPELRARGDRLQAFLKAYHDLGSDGPYMKLLHLPEAATTLRKHLGLHVAAAYALAILEDEHWLHYKGVPRDRDEEHVLEKITTIKRMALGAPRQDLDGSGDSADA